MTDNSVLIEPVEPTPPAPALVAWANQEPETEAAPAAEKDCSNCGDCTCEKDDYENDAIVATAAPVKTKRLPSRVADEEYTDDAPVARNTVMSDKISAALNLVYKYETQRRGYYLNIGQHEELVNRAKAAAKTKKVDLHQKLLGGRLFRKGLLNSTIEVEPGFDKPVLSLIGAKARDKNIQYFGFIQAELDGSTISYTLLGTRRQNPQTQVRGWAVRAFIVGEREQIEAADSFLVVNSRESFITLHPISADL